MNVRSIALVFGSLAATLALACSDGGGSTVAGDSGTPDAATTNDSGTTSDGAVVPPESPAVDITFAASCPKVTPCGGAVVGTWDYTAVCVDEPFAAYKQQCPSATITNEKGTVKGRVVFDALEVTRTSTVSFSATIGVPAVCSAGQCAAVQAALQKNADKATCKSDGGGGCSCDVSITQNTAEANGYTISGNTVKIADGSSYDYCVSGSKLSYVPSGTTEEKPGAYEMTKK